MKYGEIILEVEKLSGELTYSFDLKKLSDFDFNYNIDVIEGDFNLGVTANGATVEETGWTSSLQEQLQKEYEENNVRIQSEGGVIKIKEVDHQVSITLYGNNASGSVKITW